MDVGNNLKPALMKTKAFFLLVLNILIFYSCNDVKDKVKGSSSNESVTIYFNGDIATMEGETPQYVEAIVSENDKILFVR